MVTGWLFLGVFPAKYFVLVAVNCYRWLGRWTSLALVSEEYIFWFSCVCVWLGWIRISEILDMLEFRWCGGRLRGYFGIRLIRTIGGISESFVGVVLGWITYCDNLEF